MAPDAGGYPHFPEKHANENCTTVNISGVEQDVEAKEVNGETVLQNPPKGHLPEGTAFQIDGSDEIWYAGQTLSIPTQSSGGTRWRTVVIKGTAQRGAELQLLVNSNIVIDHDTGEETTGRTVGYALSPHFSERIRETTFEKRLKIKEVLEAHTLYGVEKHGGTFQFELDLHDGEGVQIWDLKKGTRFVRQDPESGQQVTFVVVSVSGDPKNPEIHVQTEDTYKSWSKKKREGGTRHMDVAELVKLHRRGAQREKKQTRISRLGRSVRAHFRQYAGDVGWI